MFLDVYALCTMCLEFPIICPNAPQSIYFSINLKLIKDTYVLILENMLLVLMLHFLVFSLFSKGFHIL